MAPSQEQLGPLAIGYLERQAWYQRAIRGVPNGPTVVEAYDSLREEPPGLGRLVLRRGRQRFQLLVGWRDVAEVAGLLQGRDAALVGAVEDGGDGRHVLAYDALADDELILALLSIVSGGAERAQRVRRVSTLVSHASLVFDERLFMKCYRVLEEGERPEAEVMFRLDQVGFNAMLAPVARWRAHDLDLALVREFLPSALEGRLLAFTSLRDLLAHASGTDEAGATPHHGERPSRDADDETARAGGDLASEMRRLGQMTASLHLALASAFGEQVAAPAALASILGAGEGAHGPGEGPSRLAELRRSVERIGAGGAGSMIRVHGDYHLRRVLRAETGWVVAGFSDDPLYAAGRHHPSLPPRLGSPVEDLADMCFALRRVAHEALAQRPAAEAKLARELAGSWERRNQLAFLGGYLADEQIDRLLPSDPATVELLLEAFLLARERRYEATPRE